MSRLRPRRRQRPVQGGRRSLGASVLKQIEVKVEAEAAKHGVGKSFVVSVRLAASYGIKEQEQY